MAETPFVPPTSTAYSPVFTLVRDWLGLAGLGADDPVLDSLARNIAADLCERDLAPAAYGDKRRPYYTHACAGVEGVSATLHLRDGSLELVFKDEELDLINEDGRDLYVARIEASEVLALRQWLIDFLPASEAEIRTVKVKPAFDVVAVPAPDSEERLFWLEAAEQHGFEETSGGEHIPEYDPPAYFATADEVLKLMAAAREQGRKDVLDALAAGCSPNVSEASTRPGNMSNKRPDIDRSAAPTASRGEGASGSVSGSVRDDVKCRCVGTFGPNPECGACGGSGCIGVLSDLGDPEAARRARSALMRLFDPAPVGPGKAGAR